MTYMAMSKRSDWGTPPALFAALDAEFRFDRDVCATAENAKCARFWTLQDDALAQEWTGTLFMNPPYGRGLYRWMKKAYDAAAAGATVVCLVPARTDTAWWHDFALLGEVRFVRGRLRFEGSDDRAPFPSVVVVFRPRVKP